MIPADMHLSVSLTVSLLAPIVLDYTVRDISAIHTVRFPTRP